MKQKISGYGYVSWIIGFINITQSILCFCNNKILLGILNVFVGIVFVALGFLAKNNK